MARASSSSPRSMAHHDRQGLLAVGHPRPALRGGGQRGHGRYRRACRRRPGEQLRGRARYVGPGRDQRHAGVAQQRSHRGQGVYIGVLDSGLLDTWRQYFPRERIATQYAKSFGGGHGNGNIPEQPNKWEHDVNAHGTHVTSTILGYQFGVNLINGTAPRATVI